MNADAALAAVRAGHQGPYDASTRMAVETAARRTGRRTVELGDGRLAVGWADGLGPNLDDEALVVGELSPTRLVALGVCLGLCWSPEGPPLPGRPVSLAAFEAELDRLGITAVHVKGSLPELHEMQLIAFDGHELSLGPALGAWGEADWAALRALRSALPGGER
jgi:hypothetical protein